MRIYIERHLVDEAYREQQVEAGTHFLDPATVEEFHPDEPAAMARLKAVAANWGCELTEREDNAVEHNDTDVRYFQFDGPEEEEIQGYASLYPTGSAAEGGQEQ